MMSSKVYIKFSVLGLYPRVYLYVYDGTPIWEDVDMV